jgi:hypothetical protein
MVSFHEICKPDTCLYLLFPHGLSTQSMPRSLIDWEQRQPNGTATGLRTELSPESGMILVTGRTFFSGLQPSNLLCGSTGLPFAGS